MHRLFRMWHWTMAAALLLAAVSLIAPQQISIIVYKAALLAGAASAGYWIDRTIFPYARPHEHFREGSHVVGMQLMLRRAIIVAAAMIAVGLAL